MSAILSSTFRDSLGVVHLVERHGMVRVVGWGRYASSCAVARCNARGAPGDVHGGMLSGKACERCFPSYDWAAEHGTGVYESAPGVVTACVDGMPTKEMNVSETKTETREHDLKCWPEFYAEVEAGRKTFEVRLNDRDYLVGDVLHLREWVPGPLSFHLAPYYTGRSCRRVVTYVMQGGRLGLGDGYVVLGLGAVREREWKSCKTHPSVNGRFEWGCPDCVSELRRDNGWLRSEVTALRAQVAALTEERDFNAMRADHAEQAAALYQEERDQLRTEVSDVRAIWGLTPDEPQSIGKTLAEFVRHSRDTLASQRDTLREEVERLETRLRNGTEAFGKLQAVLAEERRMREQAERLRDLTEAQLLAVAWGRETEPAPPCDEETCHGCPICGDSCRCDDRWRCGHCEANRPDRDDEPAPVVEAAPEREPSLVDQFRAAREELTKRGITVSAAIDLAVGHGLTALLVVSPSGDRRTFSGSDAWEQARAWLDTGNSPGTTRADTNDRRLLPHECSDPQCQWTGYRARPGEYVARWLATHPDSNTAALPSPPTGEE